jgi:hypothetical protein
MISLPWLGVQTVVTGRLPSKSGADRFCALLLNRSDDVCRELRVAVKDQKPVWLDRILGQIPRKLLKNMVALQDSNL